MAELLPALEGLPPVVPGGGAVRDRCSGRGGPTSTSRSRATRSPPPGSWPSGLAVSLVEHGRFGTAAAVRTATCSLDLAGTRRETYPSPGALPDVEPAALSEDLARRDFSVNAMAIPLRPGRRGRR